MSVCQWTEWLCRTNNNEQQIIQICPLLKPNQQHANKIHLVIGRIPWMYVYKCVKLWFELCGDFAWHPMICSWCQIKLIVTDALWVTDALKGVITCLKCQVLFTPSYNHCQVSKATWSNWNIMFARQYFNWYAHSVQCRMCSPQFLKQPRLVQTQTGLHNYTIPFSSTACASAQTSF